VIEVGSTHPQRALLDGVEHVRYEVSEDFDGVE